MSYYDQLLEAREHIEYQLDDLQQSINEAETEAEKDELRRIYDNMYKKLAELEDEIIEEENAAR